MTKPKLLYIGRSLPCRTETFVYQEILELRKQGWSVDTISVHSPQNNLGNPQLEEMAESAIKIYPRGVISLLLRFLKELLQHPKKTIKSLWRSWIQSWRSPLSFEKCVKVLLQTMAALSIVDQVRKLNIEHIHAQMAHVPTTMAWILGFHLKLPFSFTGHAADIFRDDILLKEKLESCHFCVCISKWHRHFYQSITPLPGHWLPVIHCGVNLLQFHKGETQQGLILSVGRLVPKKGLNYLIEACGMLKKRGVEFECQIIGEGPERAFLEEIITDFGLENQVKLLGAKTHQEIRVSLSKAELFVLPCITDVDGDRDGIPMVLMEAMASGVPVVAGDLPTVKELIDDGKNGRMIDPKVVGEMTEKIHQLLLDKSLQEKFRNAAFMTLDKKFDLSKNVKKLGDQFQDVRETGEVSNIGRKLLIITPCRNEAKYFEQSMNSILNQTLLPASWVIVDDGSTDETPQLLQNLAEKYPFISVIHRKDRGKRKVGPGVIETFYEGLESQDWKNFDYLCKLDCDVVLPSDYFESLIEVMEQNPRLGTFSGKAYYANRNGELISEKCSDETSQGMTKLYRTGCFEEIGGFVREVMWDGIDCHRCRMLGWQAASWDHPRLRFLHLRPMGSSEKGILTGRMRHGYGQYFMGTGPVYMLVSSVYRMFLPPFFVGGVSMFLGYLKAWWSEVPRYGDLEFTKFLNAYQWSCLLRGKKQATKRLDRQQEKVWLEKHRQDKK